MLLELHLPVSINDLAATASPRDGLVVLHVGQSGNPTTGTIRVALPMGSRDARDLAELLIIAANQLEGGR